MAKRKRDWEQSEPAFTDDGLFKLHRGSHHHTAELYGECETLGLRPWARERVLEQIGSEGVE